MAKRTTYPPIGAGRIRGWYMGITFAEAGHDRQRLITLARKAWHKAWRRTHDVDHRTLLASYDLPGAMHDLYLTLRADCDEWCIVRSPNDVIWLVRTPPQAVGIHFWTPQELEKCMSVLRKRADGARRTSESKPLTGALFKDSPSIMEHLTATSYPDDDGARETSTVTLSYDQGTWKASINDRDQRQSAFVSAATPEEALKALEYRLENDELDWRAWKGGAWGGSQKKGKKSS